MPQSKGSLAKNEDQSDESPGSFPQLTPSKLDTRALEKYMYPHGQFQTEDDVLKHKGYCRKDKLGSGGYGVVFKLVRIKDNVPLAAKKISFHRKPFHKMEKYLHNELYVLLKCRHPNVIDVKDCFFINHHAFIVMEYANGGSLARFAKSPQPETIARKFFVQILQGLLFLHQNKIAHRDIKLDNILLVYADNVCKTKLTDFGLSKLVFHQKKSYIEPGNYAGTRSYMAPEIVRIRVYPELEGIDLLSRQFPADVWALGVCLFELLTTHCPFDAYCDKEMLRLQENKEYTFPSGCQPGRSCLDLISKIFEPNPLARIDPFGMLTHEWILQEYE